MSLPKIETNIPESWILESVVSEKVVNGINQKTIIINDIPEEKPPTSWKFDSIVSEEKIDETTYVKALFKEENTLSEEIVLIKVSKDNSLSKEEIIDEEIPKIIEYKNKFHTNNSDQKAVKEAQDKAEAEALAAEAKALEAEKNAKVDAFYNDPNNMFG